MIKFVYFDLGNVLVGFSHRRACEQLAKCCGVSPDKIEDVLFGSQLQLKFEAGKVDTLQVCAEIRSRFSCVASDDAIVTAISDIFWPIPENVAVMSGLIQAGIGIGVLSNTCDAHWKWVTSRIYRWLPSRLDQCVLSYEVGCAKPVADIFQLAIERTGLRAEEIFFMDDIMENVNGALNAGIRAVHYTHTTQLYRDLWSALRGD